MAKETYQDILESLQGPEEWTNTELHKKEIKRAIRSAARSVLPNATETKILITANARAIRNFLKFRGSIPGDEEMRRVAAALLKILRIGARSFFFDFRIDTLPDGSPIVVHETLPNNAK